MVCWASVVGTRSAMRGDEGSIPLARWRVWRVYLGRWESANVGCRKGKKEGKAKREVSDLLRASLLLVLMVVDLVSGAYLFGRLRRVQVQRSSRTS